MNIDKCCPDLIYNTVKLYTEDRELYTCTLNMADIDNNCNKFYIIQLLVNKDKKCYFILTRCGRVGYFGSSTIDCFLFKKTAIDKFQSIFHDKTGVNWKDRYITDPIEGKYTYIVMHEPEEDKKVDHKGLLSTDINNLMGMIFDPDNYEKLTHEFKLDRQRAPLGAIGKIQITKAYNILDRLVNYINMESTNDTIIKISKATSEFYSIIPTYHGMSRPPPIDSHELVNNKAELLEILSNVAIMGKMSCPSNGLNFESQYAALDCEIRHISPSENMYNIIDKYLTVNSGKHRRNLTLVDLFEINRYSENISYMKWSSCHNRQLLWHGSRLVNYVGILSEGLKIRPSGVALTGSMFGNGVYFANCSTKSAQYMAISRDIGIMLLCEVALGNTYKLTNAEHIKSLPIGKHSTHGLGFHSPCEDTYITMENGTLIPYGKLVEKSNSNGSLGYDEFVVYNTDQIRIRYLVVVKSS